MTILLGLNQPTAFAMLQSKLIAIKSRIQKPSNSKDGALYNNCERLKTVDYYRKVLLLNYARVHGSVSDNQRTINCRGC